MQQHRLYFAAARTRAEAAATAAERHGALARRLPRLVRYVQNRPLLPAPFALCSETWFADRDEERAAFASDYYRHVVRPDEHASFDPALSWNAAVAATHVPRPGPRAAFRLLTLREGPLRGAPAAVTREEQLVLARPFRGTDHRVVTSWWCEEIEPLAAAADIATGIVMVCRTHLVPAPGDALATAA